MKKKSRSLVSGKEVMLSPILVELKNQKIKFSTKMAGSNTVIEVTDTDYPKAEAAMHKAMSSPAVLSEFHRRLRGK